MSKSPVPNVVDPEVSEELAPEPTWLANLRDCSLSRDTVTLSLTVHSILDSITAGDYTEVDKHLATVDVTKAVPSHLLAVLRSLFTWRSVLVQWPILRDKALQHYRQEQVHGVENAFKGLM
jgi:hypothetical protein